jgi:hypothetical protein
MSGCLSNPPGFAAISRWLRNASDDTTGLEHKMCPLHPGRDASRLRSANRERRRCDPCRDRRKNHLRIVFRGCRFAQPPANRWHPCRDAWTKAYAPEPDCGAAAVRQQNAAHRGARHCFKTHKAANRWSDSHTNPKRQRGRALLSQLALIHQFVPFGRAEFPP